MKVIVFTILLVVAIGFVLFISSSAFAINEEECETGNGAWTEKIGCDPREEEICPRFYCKCLQGFEWKNNTCTKISYKNLCEASDGKWINDECICPENSIGFRENIGCDYISSVQNKDKAKSNNLILTSLLTLIILIFVIFFLKMKAKSKK